MEKVENADGYEYTIKREETTVVSQKVPDDETEAVAEGLESETSYTLALRALGNNEYEDSSWREISFTTRADEPEPPSHVAIPDKVLEKYLSTTASTWIRTASSHSTKPPLSLR